MAAAPDYVQQPLLLFQGAPFYLFLTVNLVGEEECSGGIVLFSGEDTVEKKIVWEEPCFYGEDTVRKRKYQSEPYCYGEDTVEKRKSPPEPCCYGEDTVRKKKKPAGTVLLWERYG